eukprot:1565068-Ditylum_brightwellii.AAC.1
MGPKAIPLSLLLIQIILKRMEASMVVTSPTYPALIMIISHVMPTRSAKKLHLMILKSSQ